MKLNIGCGDIYLDGYINIDKSADLYIKPDLIWDLENGLPKDIPDNSVDEIKASHIFEHINNIYNLIDDCYRVLKKGGIIKVITPNALAYNNTPAYSDPTHVHFWNEGCLIFFITKNHNPNGEHLFKIENLKIENYEGILDFDMVKI